MRSDEHLFENIRKACLRGLPEIRTVQPEHSVPICMVGSGPSLAGQLEALRELKRDGAKVMAIRDAHDYLIARDIVPDFALSVDPLPTAADCFKSPHPEVHYLIASQSDDAMFDFLKDANVTLWHGYMKDGQTEPKKKLLIGGHTTSGMRGIAVAYVLGYREFHLFGIDSCMSGDTLRVNGTGAEADQEIFDIEVERGGRKFRCNPAMGLQAQNFQDLYEQLPNAQFIGYGDGLIQAIIEKRVRDKALLDSVKPIEKNGRVSFIHAGGPQMASYRYRAAIPAIELGAMMNDYNASTLVFSKPLAHEILLMAEAQRRGQRVIVDFCDDHFGFMHYQEAVKLADAVVCSTKEMQRIIKELRNIGRDSTVIPDPYEFPERHPHFNGSNLLWFGHECNRDSLQHLLDILVDHKHLPFHVVSNLEGAIPWSHQTMVEEFEWADMVLMPKTTDYKSANRTVESIRQGCFVIAEPHPAIMDIPGVWIGDIKEGIEWARTHRSEVLQRISTAQKYVMDTFTPTIVSDAWRTVIQSLTTSDAETSTGKDGSTSTLMTVPT